MELNIRHFDELTADELYEILKLRSAVFVVEQSCAYQDIDGLDRAAYHVWLSDEAGIAAYLRILPPGTVFDEPAIGRVISVRRRCGIGSKIMREALSAVQRLFRSDTVTIEAQLYAKPFYERLGFTQISDEFDEDGIPHILMKWHDSEKKTE